MVVVTITAPDGYVFARLVSLAQVDRFVEDCISVLGPGEGITIMASKHYLD